MIQSWGERVVRVRNGLCMTQPEFANRLGVSAATIALWEGKESRPYSKEAEKFMAFEEAYDRGEVEPIQPDEVENWQKVFRGRRG